MKPTDADAFSARMVVLAEIFGESFSPVRMGWYFTALEDLEADDVFAALGQAARACTFFPKPAELREFVGVAHRLVALASHDASDAIRREHEQRRLEAWEADLAQQQREQDAAEQRRKAEWEAAAPDREAARQRGEAAFVEFQAAMRAIGRRLAWPGSHQS